MFISILYDAEHGYGKRHKFVDGVGNTNREHTHTFLDSQPNYIKHRQLYRDNVMVFCTIGRPE